MLIGEKLKEARLEKGYTLEDIGKMTKIQTRHLRAIEENNFSYIPGNFYARVFIKEYANVVDLDFRALLVEHKEEMPASGNEVDYTQLRRSRKKSSSNKSSPITRFLPTLIVIILLFGVMFFIWKTASNPDRPSNQGDEENGTEQSAGDQVSVPSTDNDDVPDDLDEEEPDETEDEEVVIEDEPELIFISYGNNTSHYQFNTTDDVIELVVESSGRNWLEVENEAGESQYYATLQASESPVTFDVSTDARVYMRFGNPIDISISINGVELELPDEVLPSSVPVLWLYINEEPDLE